MLRQKVVITGASGLLGRATAAEFEKRNWTVVKLAYQRAREGFTKVNLLNQDAVCSVLEENKPNVIVHCAAERNPDKCEKSRDSAKELNVESTRILAEFACKTRTRLLLISSDYVFDGENAPYREDASTNPINYYGVTKAEAEKIAIAVNPRTIVLRVPVLYGDEEYIGESAVSSLIKNLFHKETVKVSNTYVRYPTLTSDVAKLIVRVCEDVEKIENFDFNPILHWSADDGLTKYEMTKIIAEVFGFSCDHIIPNDDPEEGTARPKDVKLDRTNPFIKRINQPYTKFKNGVAISYEKFFRNSK